MQTIIGESGNGSDGERFLWNSCASATLGSAQGLTHKEF